MPQGKTGCKYNLRGQLHNNLEMAHQGHQVQKPIYEQSLKAKDKLCKLLFKSNIFEKQRQTLPITFQTKYLWKAKTNYANYF